jgi:hypothetical protein
VLGSLGTTTTVLHGNAAGAPSFAAVVSADMNITTTSCTSQFVTAISAGGVGTCTTDTLASAQHANQGTTTTLLHGNAAGNPSFGAVVSADMNITPTSCTNQFVTAISAGGVGTCTTDTLASAQHANQGTTTTVLHGNAAGNPSFAAVSLTADVSGGTNDNGSAYTVFTPTIACNSGSIGTNTLTGRYKTLGKMADIHVRLQITTNSTCAGALTFGNMPITFANTWPATAYGRENGVSGKLVYGKANSNATTISNVTDYTAAYPGADGADISVQVFAETN